MGHNLKFILIILQNILVKMNEQCILIHYHEIGLKGDNRSWFEKIFINNIKRQLQNLPYSSIKIIAEAGEGYVGSYDLLQMGRVKQYKELCGLEQRVF